MPENKFFFAVCAVSARLCAVFFALAFFSMGTLFGAEKLRVVATFSVPADWVCAVAGERAEVVSLAPANADNHAYSPSPGDVKKLRDADFVFAISPDFEVWFDAISKNVRAKNPQKFIFLGEKFIKGGHHSHSHCDCDFDPHVWTDPEIVASEFVPAIARAIGCDGEKYATELRAFSAEARKRFDAIPRERRKIVTYHANMTHFAERFGLEIAGTILASASTEAADPSAKSLSRLARKIRAEKIPIFVDNTVSSRIPAALARDAGVSPPRILRVDALDVSGAPAGTYLGMMRENVREIVSALEVAE